MASVLTLVTACERDRQLPSADPAASTPASSATESTAPSSAPPVTTGAPSTDPASTSTPTTSVTAPTSTAPPAPTLPPPTFDPVAGLSELFDQPLEFTPVAEFEGLQVSEALVQGQEAPVRCIVIRRDADHTWFRCLFTDVPDGFVIVDGADPWWVDVGPVLGQVTLTKQPATWTLFSNGCTDPIAQIVGATDTASGAFSGIACGGQSAVLAYPASSAQRLPLAGGGVLVVRGAEGWNEVGGGSSLPCPYLGDGVDRCPELGVEADLFEAILPVPPPTFVPPQEMVVNLLDLTVEADAMAFGATDVANAADLIAASVAPIDAEVPPGVVIREFGPVAVVVVEVPGADDSIRTTSWAVWFDVPPDGSLPTVRHGYVWTNCARGVSGGVCV